MSTTPQGYIIKNGARVSSLYSFKHNDSAVLDQAPPVQNTWYTILNTVYNARLLTMAVLQTNTETNAKDIEVRWTIDGSVFGGSAGALANNTLIYFYRRQYAAAVGGLTTSGGQATASYGAPIEGQSIKIEVRTTSAPGTAQHLTGYAVYETLQIA